jgi:hypothetical protein
MWLKIRRGRRQNGVDAIFYFFSFKAKSFFFKQRPLQRSYWVVLARTFVDGISA